MWRDPIVAEVRRNREQYAARFNYDIEAICCAARDNQKKTDGPIVTLAPKRVTTEAKAVSQRTASSAG